MKNKDLSVLILSCDKYSHLITPCIKLLEKHWEPLDEHQIYISTGTIPVKYKDAIPITTGEINWSTSLLRTLDLIETPYLFLILEDVFYTRKMSTQALYRGLNYVKKYNLDKYIYHYPHEAFQTDVQLVDPLHNVYKLNQNCMYTTTTQTGIWRVEFFKKCLKEGESPWQFELDGTQRLNSTIEHNIFMEIAPRYYTEALVKGQLTDDYYRMIQTENLI